MGYLRNSIGWIVTCLIIAQSVTTLDAKPRKKKKIIRVQSQHKAAQIDFRPKRPKGFEHLNFPEVNRRQSGDHTVKQIKIEDPNLWSKTAFSLVRVGGVINETPVKGANPLNQLRQHLLKIHQSIAEAKPKQALYNLEQSKLVHIEKLQPLYYELIWKISMLTQDTKQHYEAASNLLTIKYLPSSLEDRVRLSVAQSIFKMNLQDQMSPQQLQQALSTAEHLSQHSKSTQVRAQAFGLLAKFSKSAQAQQAKKSLWQNYGHTPIAQSLIEHWPNPSKEDWFLRGKALFKQRSYKLALRSFQHLLSEQSSALIQKNQASQVKQWRQEAALLTAISWMRLRKNDELSEHMLEIAANGPQQEIIQSAWFYRGILWGRMQQWEQAIDAMKTYADLKKTGSRAQEARYQVGRLLHQAGRYDEAIKAHRIFLKTRPKDPNKYQWFLGWSYYRKGDCRQAQREWKSLISDKNLLVGAKAKYWTARCDFKMGKKRRALRMIKKLLTTAPLSYYALLSQHLKAVITKQEFQWKNPLRTQTKRHFKSSQPSSIQKWLKKLKRKRGKDYKKHIVLHDLIQSALALATVGGERFAQVYYREICHTKEQRALLSKALGKRTRTLLCDALAQHVGEYGELWKKQAKKRIPWLEGLVRKSSSDRVGAYPLAYYELAQAASQVEGVSPWWLMAHMLQESRYRPTVVSYAQAIGLMQILARTGIRIAQRLQWPPQEFYGDLLFDPALSLRYAAWYLKSLWADLGHPILAIGAYNGGPMRFADHMESHPQLDFDELVEEMGAHESRNYMRKVTEHFIRYLAMYASPAEWKAWTRVLAPPTHHLKPKRTVGF